MFFNKKLNLKLKIFIFFYFRFVLNLIKIFDGCFGGVTLYENPNYVAPIVNRRLVRERASVKYNNKLAQKVSLEQRKPDGGTFPVDPTDDVFNIEQQ